MNTVGEKSCVLPFIIYIWGVENEKIVHNTHIFTVKKSYVNIKIFLNLPWIKIVFDSLLYKLIRLFLIYRTIP